MSKYKTAQEKLDYVNSEETQRRLESLMTDSALAAQPDTNQLNPWQDNQQALTGNISSFDAMGLQLMTLVNEGIFRDNPPSPTTKAFIQKFIENSIGNSQLNAFLNQDAIKGFGYADYLTKSTAVNDIAYFSYKTRNLAKMEDALQKLQNVHEAVLAGKPIDDKDKLTLKEFAVVSELAKTLPILEQLHKSGLIEGNEKLEKMYKNAARAKELISHIEMESTKDLQKSGPGVLVLDNTQKKSHIFGKALAFVEKIVAKFSSHGHASMLHFNSKGKAKRSHINPQLLHDDFDINKQLYSNMYKVDPIALIPKEKHQLLEQVYGKNWQAEVANKFQAIENQIHGNLHDRFGGLSASGNKDQYLAGLANLIPFGHKKMSANDFGELHKKVMEGGFAKGSKMLCSEFCATTIAASIVELDKQIKEDIRKSKVGKLTGVDLDKETIVKVPFGKHENLHKMHPDRLLKVLKSHNCVQPVVTTATKYVTDKAVKIGKALKEKTKTKKPPVKTDKGKKQSSSLSI